MKIVVLLKQVPDTYGERRLNTTTGFLERDGSELVGDEVSERALEVALTHQQTGDVEVVVLTVGPASAKEALRRALAMGAGSAVHVIDDGLRGSDMVRTSRVLAAALRKIGFDLVVAGSESTDGRGGIIPALVAEALDIPQLTFLESISISAGEVQGRRRTEYGSVDGDAQLPAIVSITEALPEPRFPSLMGAIKAKKKPLVQWSLSDLDAMDDSAGYSSILSVTQRPVRQAGTKITDDGSAGSQLADFLDSNHLI